MIPKEIYKKVRRIEIVTNRLVSDVFAGQYHSVFKGQGIEFDEVREYQMGDDVRSIDWNVTARTGRPHIKKYIEEREQTVMILLDVSASSRFGSLDMLKSQLAAEIAAILAFSAIRNNDNVGLIIFSDKIEKFIPPRKGTSHVLRVIREALYFEPKGTGTDVAAALDYLNQVTRRKAIAFLISDFLMSMGELVLLKKKLSVAHRRHDVIALGLHDRREEELPASGLVLLEDAETGESQIIDTSSQEVRSRYEDYNKKRLAAQTKFFQQIGMDYIFLTTHESYADVLVKFFKRRRKRQALRT